MWGCDSITLMMSSCWENAFEKSDMAECTEGSAEDVLVRVVEMGGRRERTVEEKAVDGGAVVDGADLVVVPLVGACDELMG